MKRLLLAVAAAVLLAAPVTAGAAWAPALEPDQIQGWHLASAFPSLEHEHVYSDLQSGEQLNGQSRTFNVRVLFHNIPSSQYMSYVRWSCESTVIQVVNTHVTGNGTAAQDAGTYALTLTPSKCPGIGREIRVTANFVTPTGRKFTTTRTCVNTTGSGTNYCGWGSPPTSAGRYGGGYWDEVNLYSIAFVDGRDLYALRSPAVAGQTVRFKAQAGTLRVFLDPNFHAGSSGTLLATAAHGVWTGVKIPSGLTAGVHHLVAIDERTNHAAGVYVVPFTIG